MHGGFIGAGFPGDVFGASRGGASGPSRGMHGVCRGAGVSGGVYGGSRLAGVSGGIYGGFREV